MRNPVNRLATAAPRAFDSILKQPTTKSDSTTNTNTTTNTDKNEQRNRGASFDLSMLLNTITSEGVGGASGESVDETASVVTFDAATVEDMIHNSSSLDCCWGWNKEDGEVGL